MATKSLSDAVLHETYTRVMQHGGVTLAARAMGLNRATLEARWHRARVWAEAQGLPIRETGPQPMTPVDHAFEIAPLPDELPTADELIARRKKQFGRKREAAEARHLVNVTVRREGPIGLAFVGDPHVDDNGTDIDLLEQHLTLIKKHDCLLPLGIGDYSNNWVGRLARLHGQQSVSAAEAWVLVEWLVKAVDWLVLVSGNHDAWSGDGDPIKWMAKAARVQYESNGVRLGLTLPNGRVIRVNARHDFRGSSMWNTSHGIAKAATQGWRDHVLTAGHTHVSGIQVVRDPMSGLISHCLRIGSYKRLDRFADERGLPNQTFTVCPVVVVRPQYGDDDNRLLTTFFEPETAALFLQWLRRRKSEAA